MVNNIEDKLKEYRWRKENERQAELRAQKPLWQRYLPESLIKWIETKRELESQQPIPVQEPDDQQAGEYLQPDAETRLRPRRKTVLATTSQETLPDVPLTPETRETPAPALKWALISLKFLLWCVLFTLSVEVEFGAVFILFSLFYLILTNLHSGRRKPWEPSAYSVFNPGCEAIDGTLKAEQFERELRHGL